MSARPDWDDYFLGIARAVSARADCTRRRVGAVIVKDNRIVSTGYNGAPAGEPGCLTAKGCLRGRHYLRPEIVTVISVAPIVVEDMCACGSTWPCPEAVKPGSSYDTGSGACIAVHAEANALLYADYDRCKGAVLYCTDEPCEGCARLVKAAGITRTVTTYELWRSN